MDRIRYDPIQDCILIGKTKIFKEDLKELLEIAKEYWVPNDSPEDL